MAEAVSKLFQHFQDLICFIFFVDGDDQILFASAPELVSKIAEETFSEFLEGNSHWPSVGDWWLVNATAKTGSCCEGSEQPKQWQTWDRKSHIITYFPKTHVKC